MRPSRALRTARRAWREFLRTATDLLLPPECPTCGTLVAQRGLCGPCDQNLVRRGGPCCVRCGERVVGGATACGGDHRELRHLSHLVAPWRFAGTGGAFVRRFKLDANAAAGFWIARAMANAWRRQVGDAFGRPVLVPVPLHAARRRKRGFDQAAWLAHEVAARLGLGALDGALRRTRATLPQGDPRVTSREANVDGVFAIGTAREVFGRNVLLVDDVFTSGATARACAAVLRAAGARAVAAIMACRS